MKPLHACPSTCKRLRLDDTESDRAQERHRALKTGRRDGRRRHAPP